MTLPAPRYDGGLTRSGYSRLNQSYWASNAAHWLAEPDNDPFRTEVFRRVVAGVCESAEKGGLPFRVCDLGCGEGAFLRLVSDALPAAELTGVDVCGALLDQARVRSGARYLEADIQSGEGLEGIEAEIVTCILTLIELAHPERALAIAHRLLTPGGALYMVLLDPAVETYRYLADKQGQPGTAVYNVEGELVVASHYVVAGARSPAPYFRFLRPLDTYLDAALGAGFTIETVQAAHEHGEPFLPGPQAILVVARKTAGPGRSTPGNAST